MIYSNDWSILCIGINNYIVEAKPLEFCVPEARDIFGALRETTSGKHCLLLNPSSAELRQAVDTFIENSRTCRRNLLSFSGHGYEHLGQLHLKSPDSATFSADVSVNDIREKLPERSLFVCYLGCCRVDVTRAMQTPRMVLITPVRDSVRTYLRQKLRMLRPVSREHFYLYVVLDGEEAIDLDFGFGAILRGRPESTIEEVARQLKRRHTHVEWKSNLDRWSGNPIGQARRSLHRFRIMLASLVVCCILGGCSMWLQLAEQLDYPTPLETVTQLAQNTTYFCDGPYFRLSTRNVSIAEEVLTASEDDVSKVCLAHLYLLMNKHENARKLSGPLCTSSASQLARAFACEIECRLRGEDHTSGCSRYSLATQGIANTRDEESLACNGSRLSAVRAEQREAKENWKNIFHSQMDRANKMFDDHTHIWKAWAKFGHSQERKVDPYILQTTLSLLREYGKEDRRMAATERLLATFDPLLEDMRIASDTHLVNIELLRGNFTAAFARLADLGPLVGGVATLPLTKRCIRFYCSFRTKTWFRAGSVDQARNWFFRALGDDDLDQGNVFVFWGSSLLSSKVDEATRFVLLSKDLMRETQDLWRIPICRDQADVTRGWVINPSCLEQELFA